MAIDPTPAEKVSLKSKLANYFLHFIGSFSIKTLHAMSRLIGRLLYYSNSSLKQVVTVNLQLCFPNQTTKQRNTITQATLIENTKLLLEMAYLWHQPHEKGQELIRTIEGEHLLDEALANKQSLLMILPHFGNWELTNHYLTSKTPLKALYKPAKLPDIDRSIKHARTLGGTEMVPTNTNGVKELLTCLKKGGVSVILPDQSPPIGSGIFGEFYGIPAYTSPLLPKLLKKTGAQCLCIYAFREASGQFKIIIEKCHPNAFNTEMEKAIEGMNKSVETCIEKDPKQYLWTYKRFKIQPEGMKNPYDNSAAK